MAKKHRKSQVAKAENALPEESKTASEAVSDADTDVALATEEKPQTVSVTKGILPVIDKIVEFLYVLGYAYAKWNERLAKELYTVLRIDKLAAFLAPIMPHESPLVSIKLYLLKARRIMLSMLTGAPTVVFEDKLGKRTKKRYFKAASKRVLAFAIPVAAMVAATFWVIRLQQYVTAYNVYLDGSKIATVEKQNEYYTLEKYVNNYISSLTGTESDIDYDVSFKTTFVNKQALKNQSDVIIDALMQDSDSAITRTYGLYIDGNLYLVNNSAEYIQNQLDRLKDTYAQSGSGSDTTVEFIQDVAIKPTYVSDSSVMSEKETEVAFAQELVAPILYTSGDTTFDSVARSKFDPEGIELGISGYVKNGRSASTVSVPISVKVMKTVEYETYAAYTTERVANDNWSKGKEVVTQKGKQGVTKIVDKVFLIDGVEVSRQRISKTVVSEPVTKIVTYGTKSTAATGKFRWPVSGTVTSPYGYRRSGFHTGIDIAAPRGTAIYAADGGKVISAGWSGSYGMLVKIDHGNGYVTYYAHCSAILVKAGQSVTKGEQIAKVGSTGNSTGNHCHFEVRINGQHKNPRNYLS